MFSDPLTRERNRPRAAARGLFSSRSDRDQGSFRTRPL